MIRRLIQRDIVFVVNSIEQQHLQENIRIVDFEIDENDMELIEKLDCNGRIFWFNQIKG